MRPDISLIGRDRPKTNIETTSLPIMDRPKTVSHTWRDFRTKDLLCYPFPSPIPSQYQHSDSRGRSLPLLLQSLSIFGQLCLQGSITNSPPFDPVTVAALTALCMDSTSPDHFDVLFAAELAAYNTGNQFILNANVLPDGEYGLGDHPLSLKTRDAKRIMFYQHLHSNNWVILIVDLQPCGRVPVDGFFIGHVVPLDVDPLVHRLTKFIKAQRGRKIIMEWTQRMHLRGSFHQDNTFLIYVLLVSLHCNHKYLDYSAVELIHFKFRLKILRNFLEHHDRWLGQLQTSVSVPFITDDFDGKDQLQELCRLGWKVQDVTGDGNCGFYAMLLGLPNIGIRDFYSTNDNYKKRVFQLRLCLQHHSIQMLKEIYPPNSRDLTLPRWTLTGEANDEAIDGLSVPLCPFRSHQDYFSSRFKSDTNNHMNPGWAPHVLASRFRIRVIVYFLVESVNGRSWSVVSFEHANDTHSSEEEPHVKVEQEHCGDIADLGHRRISDLEFKRIPTIEILYQTGFLDDCPQHFQYLQRIICAGAREPPSSSETTLGEFLTNEHNIRKSIESTKTARNVTACNVTGDLMEIDPRVDGDVASIVHGSMPGTGTRVKALNQLQYSTVQRPRRPLFASKPATVTGVGARDQILQMSIAQGAKLPGMTPMPATGTRVNTPNQVQRSSAWATKPPIMTSKPSTGTRVNMQDQVQPSSAQGTKRPIVTSVQVAKKLATNAIRETRAMKYDSKKNCYYVMAGEPASTQVIVQSNMLNTYDQSLIEAANRNPDMWVGASIASAPHQVLGIGDAPVELCTGVISRYQRVCQLNSPYYPMANALFYAGYEDEAEEMYKTVPKIISMDDEKQISELLSFLQNRLPIIGSPTIYNQRLSSGKRKRRQLSWINLFGKRTEYPNLIIPKLADGTRYHAFCVVDDLIFDSTTPRALKLCMESVRWLCKEPEPTIDVAYCFNTKYSPPGTPKKYKTKGTYTHQRKDHWQIE